MNKFERYLINNGMHFQGAGQYGRIADKFIDWCKTNNLKVTRLKRSEFTNWLQQCREQGNKEITIRKKEDMIKQYYEYLGTKRNPAKTWLKNKKEHTLPPPALEKQELMNIYQSLKPHSPFQYRNKCMLGLILFQGLQNIEICELRISDIDFNGELFVQGQRRTNSRKLKLEPIQVLHLYDFLNKYRKEFIADYKDKESDKFFLTNRVTTAILKAIKHQFPQLINLQHVRASVITHWEKQDGIIEAMQKAGHRYITSTARYQTNKYDELQEQLKSIHPLEHLNI